MGDALQLSGIQCQQRCFHIITVNWSQQQRSTSPNLQRKNAVADMENRITNVATSLAGVSFLNCRIYIKVQQLNYNRIRRKAV